MQPPSNPHTNRIRAHCMVTELLVLGVWYLIWQLSKDELARLLWRQPGAPPPPPLHPALQLNTRARLDAKAQLKTCLRAMFGKTKEVCARRA